MPRSSTAIPARRIDERRPAADSAAPVVRDDDLPPRDVRAAYAWLWPWVIASIGFLITLAMLR